MKSFSHQSPRVMTFTTQPGRSARTPSQFDRIDGQLKPWCHGLLAIALLIFSVPHGKRDGLKMSGLQSRFIFLSATRQRSAHDDMPHAIFPCRFPLHPALFILRGQRAEASPDQILHRGFPSRDDLKAPYFTFNFFLSRFGRSAIDIALLIGFPVPNIDVVIQLPHAEEGGSIS